MNSGALYLPWLNLWLSRYLLVIIACQHIKKEIHFKYITSCITITYTKHERPMVDIIAPKRRRAKQGGLRFRCNLCPKELS